MESQTIHYGTVLTRTFQMVGQMFVPLAVAAFSLIAVPNFLSSIQYAWNPLIPTVSGGFDAATDVGLYGIFTLVEILIGPFVLIKMSLNQYRDGSVQIRRAALHGLRRFWPVVAGFVMSSVLTILGLMLLVIPGLILYCGWFLVLPLLLEKDIGPIDALKRSWALTDGFKVSIFSLNVIIFLITIVMAAVAGGLGGMIIAPFTAGSEAISVQQSGFAVGSALGAMISQMISAAFIVQIYGEVTRIRGGVSGAEIADIFD